VFRVVLDHDYSGILGVEETKAAVKRRTPNDSRDFFGVRRFNAAFVSLT
jgi:hypothetical protein